MQRPLVCTDRLGKIGVVERANLERVGDAQLGDR